MFDCSCSRRSSLGLAAGLTAVSSGTVTIGNSDVFAETKLDAVAAALPFTSGMSSPARLNDYLTGMFS